MIKDWLIRTKKHQILGPVSKEKVISFVQKKALAGEDEICCGNGFWFYIREHELIVKYLLGNEAQPFNPVAEVTSILSNQTVLENKSIPKIGAITDNTLMTNLDEVGLNPSSSTTSNQEITKSPSSLDLEYPQLEIEQKVDKLQKEIILNVNAENVIPEITIDEDSDLKVVKLDNIKKSENVVNDNDDDQGVLPSPEDLDYPVLPSLQEEKIEIKKGPKKSPQKGMPKFICEEGSKNTGIIEIDFTELGNLKENKNFNLELSQDAIHQQEKTDRELRISRLKSTLKDGRKETLIKESKLITTGENSRSKISKIPVVDLISKQKKAIMDDLSDPINKNNNQNKNFKIYLLLLAIILISVMLYFFF